MSMRDLMGLSEFSPPRRLAAESGFAGAGEYREHLGRSLADPVGYWSRRAGELKWSSEPREARDADGWFPGGEIDVVACCVGVLLDREGDREDLIASGGEPSRSLSRTGLSRAIGSIAGRLDRLGLDDGDRVLLGMPPGPELVACMLACLHRGLVAVPQDPRGGDAGLLDRRASSAACRGAILLAVPEERAPGGGAAIEALRFDAEWMEGGGDAPAPSPLSAMHPAVVLADGAGRPCTIPLAGLLLQGIDAFTTLLAGRKGKGDRLWLQALSHHASFSAAVFGALCSGGALALPGEPGGESGIELSTALAERGCRAALLDADAAEIRRREEPEAQSGEGRFEGLVLLEGDTVTPALYAWVREKLLGGGAHVAQVISRPEAGGFVAGPHPGALPVRPACAGPPAPGVPLEVVDHAGRRCADNVGGLAALSGPVPGLALELAGSELPIVLGMRARRDRCGEIWAVGEARPPRAHGEEVSTVEIEALLAGLEGVERVAVVRCENGEGRRRVEAFVESSAGAGLEREIRRQVAERFGEQAVPQKIRVVEDLPVTRSGKLLRSVLRRVVAGELEGLDELADPKVVRGLIENE
ncbi:MAG: AMP-binding protein [Polyangia bacterium]